MRIVFMGSSPFAIPSLQYLHENHDLICIYTIPAKPANRGLKLKPTDSEKFAIENGIPFKTIRKFSDEDVRILKSFRADFIIVASYGIILPESVLNAAKYPALNLHGSLLPKLRGASPIQYSILNGDTETGVTLQVMSKEVDAGDILLQKKLELHQGETYSLLMNTLGLFGPDLLDEFFSNYETILNNRIKQDPNLVTFAPKISKSEYEIDFINSDADIIERKIRAFDGKCWAVFDGIRIKIIEAALITDDSNIECSHCFFGDIIDKYFTVYTRNGFIRLLTIKPEGKKEMSGADFLNGHRNLLKKCCN